MKVNMTPNPLDVVTIHASQGDSEARQWEFELHNNGELIDTSEITEQLFFKSYKGGTEQILPENTSTPTTSPFKGDIKYPQGLLSDQEFTYRQSPTEEDGLAKITDVKGNTLVWNQQAKELNSTNWTAESATASYSDGLCTITPTGYNARISADANIVIGHKYLIAGDFTNADNQPVYAYAGAIGSYANGIRVKQTSALTRQSKIFTATETGKIYVRNNSNTGVFSVKNLILIDLTQLFGTGNEPTADEFLSLFNLSYYAYNQGSLLSFMGNGIKTVGFNQWDEEWELGSISNDTGQDSSSTSTIRSKNYISVLPNKEYYLHASVASTFNYRFYDADKRFIFGTYIGRNNTILIPNGVAYMRFYMGSAYGTTYNHDICINISDTERNGEYEPYTSSTLSLPISTYFPSGMKSAGNVYDELTEAKAITRVGMVDLGSLTWTGWEDNGSYIFYASITDKKVGRTNPCVCPLYEYNRNVSVWTDLKDKQITGNPSNSSVYIRNSSYTDATAFKTAMSGIYLYYELATPTETSFTTASLVTENAEIPLSNNDGVLIGKCTEELSAEPGFHDAKIKLSDSDGTCYSNKIQLHVERSPQ